MEKEFVPYELAFKLKKLGFNEPCFGYFLSDGMFIDAKITRQTGNAISAPLYQQAFKWFRENHGLDYEIPYAGNKGEYHAFVEKYVYGNNRNNPSVFSYDDAQQECLIKLIEIVENK